MADNSKKSSLNRKKYEKPVLMVIELAAEEVLAIGCKMITGTTMGSGGNDACGIVNNCVTDGS